MLSTPNSPHAPAVITDPAMPEVAVLLGPNARHALAPAFATTGHRLQRLTPRQVLYRPGRGATVRYHAEITGADGDSTTTLVAACGRHDPGDTAAVEADGVRIAVWTPATDPTLPGLGPALEPAVVGDLLESLGAGAGDVRLRLRSYRPARRAVVEATTGTARAYLKLVPTDQVGSLHRHHVTLFEHLPVPRSHGWSPELGIVVLQALRGRTLRTALDEGADELPDAAAIEALLDRLPPAVDGESRHRSSHRRHCDLLGHVVPDLADTLADLADRLDALTAATTGPTVPVHGDLHDAQLLVERDRITGLLDVDGHSAGLRTDDLGTFLAHLSVRTLGTDAATDHGQRIAAVLERRHSPRALRTAAAARLVGLASGPFRVLQRDWVRATRERVALAERWVRAAEDEQLLIPITRAPQHHGAPLPM